MGASLEYCKKKVQEGSLGEDFFEVPDQSWEVAEELSAVQFFEVDLKGERDFTYPQELSGPEEDHVNVHFSFSPLANFNHIIYRQIDHGGSIGDTLFVVREAVKKLFKMTHVDKKNPTYRDTTDLIYRIGDIVVINEIDEARFKDRDHPGLRAGTTVLIPMEIIQIVGSKEDSEFQRKFEQELSAKGETTTLSEATQEQKENWKHYGLAMWCDKCKKGISDHWGLFDYCPHCGRRIVREER